MAGSFISIVTECVDCHSNVPVDKVTLQQRESLQELMAVCQWHYQQLGQQDLPWRGDLGATSPCLPQSTPCPFRSLLCTDLGGSSFRFRRPLLLGRRLRGRGLDSGNCLGKNCLDIYILLLHIIEKKNSNSQVEKHSRHYFTELLKFTRNKA